ncbi:MAG: hypothetical protein V3W34_04135 [Phycisphaerae bacterium]
MIWLFWLGIVFTLVAPIVIGVAYGDQTTNWIAALCGAFVTFMAKIESIAELSLGPVKARMKEKMEEAAAAVFLRAEAAVHHGVAGRQPFCSRVF